MKLLGLIWVSARQFLLLLLVVASILIALLLIKRIRPSYSAYRFSEVGHFSKKSYWKLLQVVLTVFLFFLGLIVTILTLPLSNDLKNQILTIVGLALTATIALLSGTVINNFMSTLILYAIGKYTVGDPIKIDDFKGVVSEIGSLHTTIFDRTSRIETTFTNSMILSHPIIVFPITGVCCVTLSFCSDLPRETIEECLQNAVKDTMLSDFSIEFRGVKSGTKVYRVSGYASSGHWADGQKNLRVHILDRLSEAQIKIETLEDDFEAFCQS